MAILAFVRNDQVELRRASALDGRIEDAHVVSPHGARRTGGGVGGGSFRSRGGWTDAAPARDVFEEDRRVVVRAGGGERLGGTRTRQRGPRRARCPPTL